MSDKPQVKHTQAYLAVRNDVLNVIRSIAGAEELMHHVDCGMFQVTGELSDEGREAIREVTDTAGDTIPDAFDTLLILNWLCAQGHMPAGTWCIMMRA